jgi:hypothetical protein
MRIGRMRRKMMSSNWKTTHRKGRKDRKGIEVQIYYLFAPFASFAVKPGSAMAKSQKPVASSK